MKKIQTLALFAILAVGLLMAPSAIAASGCCPSLCCGSGAACCQ